MNIKEDGYVISGTKPNLKRFDMFIILKCI